MEANKQKSKYKTWRTAAQVQTVGEELESCKTDRKIADLCIKLMSGKQIEKNDLLEIPDKSESVFFHRGNPDELRGLTTVATSYEMSDVYIKSYSSDGGKVYHYFDANVIDKYAQPNRFIEKMFRTILPTYSDIILDENKNPYTPVSIIIPTEAPKKSKSNPSEAKLGDDKITSIWCHLVISPQHFKRTEESIDVKKSEAPSDIDKLSVSKRIFSLFSVLGVTSNKLGQTNKTKIFEDISKNHETLKSEIRFLDSEIIHKSIQTIEDDKIKKKKLECWRSLGKLSLRTDVKGKNVRFRSLKIQSSRIGDPDATWRDTDKLSIGLSNLTTLTNATVITFYLKMDESITDPVEKSIPCAYLITPQVINDMFLDLRDYNIELNKGHVHTEYRVLGLKRMNLEENKVSEKSFNKKIKKLEKNFTLNIKRSSISGLTPTYKRFPHYMIDAKNVYITNFRTSLAFDVCKMLEPYFSDLGIKFNPDLRVTPPVPYRCKYNIL